MRQKSCIKRNIYFRLSCTNLDSLNIYTSLHRDFEILSWLRVFISYIPIATVLIKNCYSCCLFRTLYFLRSGLQGVKVIVFPFWRKNLNLHKTWRLIQCIGKLLKPEEFPDKMNFKKYVIGHVLRKFSKPIDKWRAFLLSSYNCLPF